MGSFKSDLLEKLNEREKVALAEMIFEVCGFRLPAISAQEYLNSRVGSKTIFGFLNKKLFGIWDGGIFAARRVLDQIDAVRKLLEEVHINGIFSSPDNPGNGGINGRAKASFNQDLSDKSVFPAMPKHFSASNDEAGKVIVTSHAWQRFCRRWHSQEEDQAKIAESFRQYFARSKRIKKVHSAINYNIVRAIHEKPQRIEKYLDELSGCRFVVVVTGNGLKVMKTVFYPGC